MKFPALWIVLSFAAGIAMATRWAGPPKLWLAEAIAAIALGGMLPAGRLLVWQRELHAFHLPDLSVLDLEKLRHLDAKRPLR